MGKKCRAFWGQFWSGHEFCQRSEEKRLTRLHWFLPVFCCFDTSTMLIETLGVLLGSSFMQAIDFTGQMYAVFLHNLYLSYQCIVALTCQGRQVCWLKERMFTRKKSWEEDYDDTATLSLPNLKHRCVKCKITRQNGHTWCLCKIQEWVYRLGTDI